MFDSMTTTFLTFILILEVLVDKAHSTIPCPKFCECNVGGNLNCSPESLPLYLPAGNFVRVNINNKGKISVNILASVIRLHPDTSVNTLSIAYFNITAIKTNTFEGLGQIKQFFISHSSIKKIEKYSFRNLNINKFMLLNDSIDTIESFAFSDINATSFYIFKSNISIVEAGAFNNFNITKSLTLARCIIKDMQAHAVSKGTFNKVSVLQSRIIQFGCNDFLNSPQVKLKVKTSCNCNSFWMMEEKLSLNSKLENIICIAPPNLAGISLSQLNKTDLCNSSVVADSFCSSLILKVNPLKANANKCDASLKILVFIFSYFPFI